MQAFFLVIQVILAITLIALILVQHGKGAQAGAAFGSGASATVFGSRGSGSFLTKITTFLAIVFFANSLGLAYLSAKQPVELSLVDQLQLENTEAATTESGLLPADVVDPGATVETSVDAAAETVETATGDKPADVPEID